ncbi:protein melted-like isoform X1 [Macrosteles quadrilineatus]|uniref:protein melted-like isoform X1 n=1 Tax=Macrosteles quadrilineatus TaxID=74068 RepID=UPI0023E125EB|nr:protein melted-like isoform X1 [Macrosteles quadrilineatus]XP_054287446.1 protein melted-like isoform X1 [Macrosteles quadrilineatus]
MHELFTQVLSKKDLSKAGDLFSLADQSIVNDLTEVINAIAEITSLPDYVNNNNDQSVVEICITKATSAIRETGSIEQHADALVALLESCLNYNLKPSAKDEDPPHAKISSDIISCIFLNYNKKEVMKRALPVAVKFLHKGNRELSRNMAPYLSLAAIDNADLLSKHIQLIIDSIISGNYPLCRVLPQIYAVAKEPIHDHAMALVSLLPQCDLSDKLALLQLFAHIADNKPSLLEASLPQLCEYLSPSTTVTATLTVLLHLANKRAQMLVDYVPKVKQAAECHTNALCLAAQVISAVGKLSKERAEDALNFVLEHLSKADRTHQSMLLKEATLLCSSYPVLFTEKMLAQVYKNKNTSSSQVNQTSAGVTIVKVGGQTTNNNNNSNTNNNNLINNNVLTMVKPSLTSTAHHHLNMTRDSGGRQETSRIVITPRPRLGPDSRSTSRLHSAAHRSMTRLNIVNNSRIGLHKSMTRLSSSQQINQPSHQVTTVTTINGARHYSLAPNKVSSGGVSVTTKAASNNVSDSTVTVSTAPPLHTTSVSTTHTLPHSSSSSPLSQSVVSTLPSTNALHSLVASTTGAVSVTQTLPVTVMSHVVCPRRTNTSVTLINQSQHSITQRISVFEPYPMRDTVQHFCEKHLDKIKAYMEKVSVRIPPPAKCTIEERRAKKLAKLHFACQGRGEHCLYSRTFFTMRTRNPRVWIHLMFLALQARSPSALSSRDSSVSSLKNCWDILKCENKTFLTLVTSAFPCAKDQEAVLNELRHTGFCDVFSHIVRTNAAGESTNVWGCFLCNHPERAVGFLQDSQPVIEGQLKEKKGRWKIFRRWRTRYFTLSGAHLSYKGSKDDKEVTPIDVHQIRSVKVSRGARNIPKAFEIFTGDHSLILKPKGGKNAEEWVQCLSVVVAHSQAKDVPTRGSSLVRTSV